MIFTAFAYAEEYNNFASQGLTSENLFDRPYRRSVPKPYTAQTHATEPNTALPYKDDFFPNTAYTGKAQVLSIYPPEEPAPMQELTRQEKYAMLESSLSSRYYGDEFAPQYDMWMLLPSYYCDTADSRIMEMFLELLWVQQATVSNHDWMALAECFICQPSATKSTMSTYNSKSQRLYGSHIQRGMELLVIDQNKYRQLKQILQGS
jgi:hypothetical protein